MDIDSQQDTPQTPPTTPPNPSKTSTTKRHYKQQPTTQQLTALKLINEGLTPRKAMIKAGYTKNVANNPKKNLFEATAIQSLVSNFEQDLQSVGVTRAYLAKKYSEWLDASFPIITIVGPLIDKTTGEVLTKPDYKTQIQAGQMLKDIYKLIPDKQESNQITKRVTFEEFVNS